MARMSKAAKKVAKNRGNYVVTVKDLKRWDACRPQTQLFSRFAREFGGAVPVNETTLRAAHEKGLHIGVLAQWADEKNGTKVYDKEFSMWVDNGLFYNVTDGKTDYSEFWVKAFREEGYIE